MNPFAALQVSDDEEEFTTTPSSNQPKPAKKSICLVTQLTNRESRQNKPRSNNLKMLQNSPLKTMLLLLLTELKKTLERKDTMK